MVKHEVLITTQTLVVLIAYIRAQVHRPHIIQQVAQDLGRLLTTYVTPFYTNYN
jgi:hypothetical protein